VADATTVALVSVVVTGTTAIAVPLVNGVLESQREQREFAHERIKEDFDDLHDLLNDLTVKLYTRILGQIKLEELYSDPRRTPEADLRTEAGEQMKELLQLSPRLFIRLGREHPVTEAFAACVGSVGQALDRMDATWAAPEALEDLADGLGERIPSLWAAYHRYTDSVLQLIGARLDVHGARRR
jgi:hypothetical protein